MTGDIVWEDPEPVNRSRSGPPRGGIASRFIADLQKRPGSWARSPVTRARLVQLRKRDGYPIEIAERNVGRPNHAVYAKYVGSDEVAS